MTVHQTIPVRVWADIDVGIADFVIALNEIPGIRTLASCQGTLGEGGAAPYEAHVMVSWASEEALLLLSNLRLKKMGDNFGYVYPAQSHLPEGK
jgi:hypothetical protein